VAGVPSVSNATILYVGTDNPNLSVILGGGSRQEEEGAASGGNDFPAQDEAAPPDQAPSSSSTMDEIAPPDQAPSSSSTMDEAAPPDQAPSSSSTMDEVAPPDQAPSSSSTLVIAVAVTLGVLAAVAVGKQGSAVGVLPRSARNLSWLSAGTRPNSCFADLQARLSSYAVNDGPDTKSGNLPAHRLHLLHLTRRSRPSSSGNQGI
jgi:hypothetical protein